MLFYYLKPCGTERVFYKQTDFQLQWLNGPRRFFLATIPQLSQKDGSRVGNISFRHLDVEIRCVRLKNRIKIIFEQWPGHTLSAVLLASPLPTLRNTTACTISTMGSPLRDILLSTPVGFDCCGGLWFPRVWPCCRRCALRLVRLPYGFANANDFPYILVY